MTFNFATGIYQCPPTFAAPDPLIIGFQPKALILWWNLLTANGSGADYNFGIGFACNNSSVTEQASNGYSSQHAPGAAHNIDSVQSNAKCIYHQKYDGVISLSASINSWDATGVTFNWFNITAGTDIHYIAIGGTDITNVCVKTEASTQLNAPANQDFTLPGFQPDLVLLVLNGFIDDETTSSASDEVFSLGMATSTSSRGFLSNYAQASPGTSSKKEQLSTAICARHAGTNTKLADITSFLSTGFRLNWSINEPNPRRMNYLCIKGGSYSVFNTTQGIVAGNNTTTGLGLVPSGVLLSSYNDVSGTSIPSNARISLGAASSAASMNSIWAGANSGLIASQDSDTTKVIKMMTEGGASPTTQASAALVSLSADTMVLNWVTPDATAREILGLAFGPNPVTSVPLPVPISDDLNLKSILSFSS